MENIDVKIENGIGFIYFNRENKLNTITVNMVNDIINSLNDLKDKVNVIIIEGKKNFSAGADINQFKDIKPLEAYNFHLKLNELLKYFREYDLPIISVLNGYVLGGGLELSLSTDIRICNENAILGQPEINIGINAGAGGNVILSKVIGRNRALYMILTGEKINAKKAYEFGLVDIISNDPEKEALRIAEIIREKPINTVKLAKKVVNKSFDTHLDLSIDYEATVFGLLFSDENTKEKINKFFKK